MADEAAVLTPKARRKREHILETALGLFGAKGYAETTMRDIAEAADCSLGLTYRYFARKEELILALYQRLVNELAEQVDQFPKGPLAKRYAKAVETCLANLAPHRSGMSALFSVGLAPDSEVAVLGPRVASMRDAVQQTYLRVIQGASEKISERQAGELATLFYAAHLLFVLFWLQDRSPNQKSTSDLIQFAQEMIGRLRPVLAVPLVSKSVTRLAGILAPMFG